MGYGDWLTSKIRDDCLIVDGKLISLEYLVEQLIESESELRISEPSLTDEDIRNIVIWAFSTRIQN